MPAATAEGVGIEQPPRTPGQRVPIGRLTTIADPSVVFTVKHGRVTTLGRSGDVVLTKDAHISRRHCAITHSPADGWTITDLGSGNGTAVNGVRLAADTPTPLSPGDTIIVGLASSGNGQCKPLDPLQRFTFGVETVVKGGGKKAKGKGLSDVTNVAPAVPTPTKQKRVSATHDDADTDKVEMESMDTVGAAEGEQESSDLFEWNLPESRPKDKATGAAPPPMSAPKSSATADSESQFSSGPPMELMPPASGLQDMSLSLLPCTAAVGEDREEGASNAEAMEESSGLPVEWGPPASGLQDMSLSLHQPAAADPNYSVWSETVDPANFSMEVEPSSSAGSNSPTTLKDVWDSLKTLKVFGKPCAGGAAAMLPACPGLEVDGVGFLALPLSPREAAVLAAAAEQTPLGKGPPSSVQNTLQVDATRVRLSNPSWTRSLAALVDAAAFDLGVPSASVEAELDRLLLYQDGGSFTPHRDTERADGVFATLVVQLPSRYTGGRCVVTHAGVTQTFDLGAGAGGEGSMEAAAAFGCHYVCHYTDCEPELRPLTSGHRLALVYNLHWRPESSPESSPQSSQLPTAAAVAGGSRVVEAVQGLPESAEPLVLRLEHPYTVQSLEGHGAAALRGEDRVRYAALKAATSKGHSLHLVLLELTDDEQQDKRDVLCAVNADGSCLSTAKANDMLQGVCFSSVEESGEVGGVMMPLGGMWRLMDRESAMATGNEGNTGHLCCLLVARRQTAALATQCKSDLVGAVTRVTSAESPSELHGVIEHLVITPPAEVALPPSGLVDLARTLRGQLNGASLADRTRALSDLTRLLREVVAKTPGLLSEGLAEQLVGMVEDNGWDTVGPALGPFFTGLQSHSASLDSRASVAVIQFRSTLATRLDKAGADVGGFQPAIATDAFAALKASGSDREVLSPLVTALFESAGPPEFQSLSAWAGGTTDAVLEAIAQCLEALPRCPLGAASVTRSELLRLHQARVDNARAAARALEVAGLQAKLAELKAAVESLQGETAGGPPAVGDGASHVLPDSVSTEGLKPKIVAYLRSPACNQISVTVGGGATHARAICTRLADPVFGVTASPAGGGKSARVVLIKDAGKAKVEYERKVADLLRLRGEASEVETKLQALTDEATRMDAASGSRRPAAAIASPGVGEAGSASEGTAPKRQRSQGQPAESDSMSLDFS